MNAPLERYLRLQRAGGLAALYLGAAYLVAMPYFLVFVKYPDAVDPAEKLALLVGHHVSMQVIYLITYVIFGIALALVVLTLRARWMHQAPVLTQVATVAGLLWSVVLVASGLIFTAGMDAVIELHRADPIQAQSAWQVIEPVAEGLGGSGGELLGGLWVLLVSLAALRTRGLPKWLNWLGIATGSAGVLSVAPVLRQLQYGFGLLQIVWFIWLGMVLLQTAPRPATTYQHLDRAL